MNAKQSIAASVALAAIATAWFGKQLRNANNSRERQFDERAHREAVENFESEGGLVLA